MKGIVTRKLCPEEEGRERVTRTRHETTKGKVCSVTSFESGKKRMDQKGTFQEHVID